MEDSGNREVNPIAAMTIEELLAATTSDLDADGAFVYGAEIDQRLIAHHAALSAKAGFGKPCTPEELALSWNLAEAQRRCNRAYGEVTGYQRSGCTFGGPVAYRA